MFNLKTLPLAGAAVAAAVVMAPGSAQAALFTVDGQQYDVTTITGTYNDNTALLESQVWWGDSALARAFAEVVQDALGTPNPLDGSGDGEAPYFAFLSDAPFVAVANWDTTPAPAGFEFDLDRPTVTETAVFAVAQAVPTPALLPAVLGMGAGIVRKRKKQSEASA